MKVSEILALFIDDAPYPDPSLSQPFVVDEKLCASSRCAFVAIDVVDSCHEYRKLEGKKADTYRNYFIESEQYNELYSFDTVGSLPLTDESVLVCDECEGKGEVEFYNGHSHYEFDCSSCSGRGTFVSQHTFPIESFLYQTKFLRNAMEVTDRFSVAEKGMLFFYGKDLIGGIMPTTFKGINLTGKGQIPL